MFKNRKKIPSIEVLGSKVHMIQIPEVVELMSHWIEKESQKCHWIIVTGMHGIMEAHKDPEFKDIVNSTDLFVPDGISLIWVARYLGFPLRKRVSGPDLMEEFFKAASQKGYTSFFYGDTEETLEQLTEKLSADFPDLKVTGSYSPPFRSLTQEEDAKIVDIINQKNPDVLWVALGLPKQEKWIFEHKEKLNTPVIIGVGAAFKFLSGEVKRAPTWLGEHGLEWLWRFVHEPKKLWRRVCLDIPVFVGLVLLELIRRKHRGQKRVEDKDEV